MEAVLPVVLPLGGGLLALASGRWSGRVAAAVAVAALASSVALLAEVMESGILVYSMGGWSPPFGIVFVADALSGLLVLLSSFVFAAVMLDGTGRYGRVFHALMLFTLAGVNGSFLTGDLFNLFVWFEVMLISSYGLVAYGGGWGSVASFRYLAMNLVGSSIMLLGVGGVYRVTGTLNMAHVSSVSAGLEPSLVAPGLLLLVAFLLKAGAFPLHFWVPEAYASAPAPASAVLAGAVKKVGVYGVLRLSFFVLPGLSGLLLPISLVLGAASVLFGGVAAYSQGNLDRLLSFSSVAQIGFMLFALGIGGSVGLSAALVTLLAHGLAKPLLFSVSGALGDVYGSGEMEAMGGAASSGVLSGSYLIGALSLVGVPPLLGFFGKLLVLRASISPASYLLVAVPGSVLTVLYVARAWTEVFWGEGPEVDWDLGSSLLSIVLLAFFLGVSGVGFEALFSVVERAVELSMNHEIYVSQVLEGRL